MKSAKGANGPATDCAYGKPARTFAMPGKPGGGGSNPGGKHLQSPHDDCCGMPSKGGGSYSKSDRDGDE